MSATTGAIIDVPMPQLGVSVNEGTVIEWRFAIGDRVEADDVLCEISTDKVDSELPSPAAGTLAEILVETGQTVEVGVPLARISAAATTTGAAPPSEPSPPPETAPTSRRDSSKEESGRRYSPLVKRMAADHGLDLGQIAGTGAGGRVKKVDVERALKAASEPGDASARASASASPPPSGSLPAGSEVEPLSRIRQAIARRMEHSRATAAHCHTWIEVDMSEVEAARGKLGTTALPIVAEAAVRSLIAHPAMNAWIEADQRTLHSHVHLGIAVSLGAEGLIVPVIREAQNLKASALDQRIRDLAKKARAGSLKPDDVSGGTFTITSQGRYGTLMSAPIINQPQVGILDLQTIAKRPVVVEHSDGTDAIAVRPMTILGLSWDHRAIDGAQAAEFLATLRDNLQLPAIS